MLSRNIRLFAFAAILVIALAACSATNKTRSDKTVPESKRIELRDGGPYQAKWVARDLTMNYEYNREAGQLVISGQVKFKREKRLQNFNLEAVLIDDSGRPTHNQFIASAGGRRMIQEVPFKAEMQVPDGTWGISFGYSGTSRGSGQGSGSPNSFWQTPF